MELEVDIVGMRCSACVRKVEASLRSLPGISKAFVTLEPPLAKVNSEHGISVEQLNDAVRSAGDYSVGLSRKLLSSASDSLKLAEDESFAPLTVVVVYIFGVVCLRAIVSGNYEFDVLMNTLMGTFFLTFSLFKMMNLSGFAVAFARYDLLASRSRWYGTLYPFLEVLLGLAYLLTFAPLLVNALTFGIMTIGGFGIAKSLWRGERIRCACLGSVFNLPMTKVTLIENAAMGLMALAMVIRHL